MWELWRIPGVCPNNSLIGVCKFIVHVVVVVFPNESNCCVFGLYLSSSMLFVFYCIEEVGLVSWFL